MGAEWNRTTRYIVGIGLVLFFLYLLVLSRQVIPLFVLAALLSFLIRPVVRFTHTRLRIPKAIAVPVIYLLAVIVIGAAPLVLTPTVITAVEFLASLDYQLLVNNFYQWLRDSLTGLQEVGFYILGFHINLDSFVTPLLEGLQDTGPVIAPSLPPLSVIINSINSAFNFSFGIAFNVLGTVFSVSLSILYLFIAGIYLSLDGGRLYSTIIDNVPEEMRKEIVLLLGRLEHIWDAFLRGQLTLMFLIGMVVWLGGTALGLPGAFALGVIAGLLEIIPSVGPIVSTVPAVIVALLQGSYFLPVNNLTFALIVILFYFLVQQLENYVVVPRVLGQAVELHPLVVLTGVLIGATAFGILGALLASPTIASIIAIVRYLYRKITNKAPFLEQELTPASIKPLVPEKIHVLWNRMRTNLVSRIKSVKSRRKEDQATNPLPEEERRPMQNVKDQDRKQS
jgi:predicted PurR-regulated permease PerM